MMNPITSLSGGGFLLFYLIITAAILFACHGYVLSRDPTRSMTAPELPGEVDSYEIAYLHGGQNELTRVIIVGLAERRYLRITTEKTMFSTNAEKRIEHADNRPGTNALSAMEQTVYDWFLTARTGEEVFSGDLPSRVSSYCLEYEEKLQQQHLLRDESSEIVGWNAGLLGGAAIVGIGGLRLLVGLDRGEPVGFLAGMLLVGILILIAICSPDRLTARGQAYFERLKLSQDTLAHSTGTRYALATALLGVSSLAGTPYEEFEGMFEKSQSSSTGGCGGGGCGDGGCGGCG